MPVGYVSVTMPYGIDGERFNSTGEILRVIYRLIKENETKLKYINDEEYDKKNEPTKFFKRIYFGYLINGRLNDKVKALQDLWEEIHSCDLKPSNVESTIKGIESKYPAMYNSLSGSNTVFKVVLGVFNFYLTNPHLETQAPTHNRVNVAS